MRAIFGLMTALALAAGVLADGHKPPFQPMDVFALEHAADPQIAPDGDSVVYVRHFADVMSDTRYSNLWMVAADGSDHKALTNGLVNAHTPRWSPDGRRLAYISNVNADGAGQASPQIFVRDMASGTVSQITTLTEAPSGITWSPDGTALAFTMLKREAPLTIGTMPSPPKGATWHAGAFTTDKLVYRFNGAGYLPDGYTHIFTVPADGGTPKQISSGDYHHGGIGRRAGPLSWTADGKAIVLSANRRSDADQFPHNTDVFAFDVTTGEVRQLTTRDGGDNGAQVSPDGKWLAYTGFDDQRLGFHTDLLYVQDIATGDRRVLTADLDRSVHSFRWASDSAGLYAAYDDGGVTQLAYVDLGGTMTPVTDNISGNSGYSAYGGVAAFTVAPGGRIAAVKSFGTSAEDIYVGARGDDFAQVTAVNDDLFDQRSIGAVEEITYTSSKDGRRVQGWMVLPPDFDATRKYPLLIEIHGGPFANYGPRFDFEKQLFAAQGMVVLYVNPRGSTSYGAEFANLIHHNYPSDDFDDLISGVDAAIAKGFVDPDRLYVAGGSGGGVLTSWVIGRSNRFKAAVIFYPVIEWESFNLTTDIPFVNYYWFPGEPWKHREHYGSRSLLSVIESVTTPSLLITGEADHRTPISQTEQYYTALKLRGIDTAMVRVPDEPHGIRVHPSHWLAKLTATMGWIDKYR